MQKIQLSVIGINYIFKYIKTKIVILICNNISQDIFKYQRRCSQNRVKNICFQKRPLFYDQCLIKQILNVKWYNINVREK